MPSLFGTGSGLVSVPGGVGSAVTAFDQSVDGGAVSEFAIWNSDVASVLRFKVSGPSVTTTLQNGSDAGLIPPNTMLVLKSPNSGIFKITVWGEDQFGNAASPLRAGMAIAKG